MFGKLIGGVLGLLGGGPLGLLIGLFVGHLFDRGFFKALQFASPENIARIRKSFAETLFLLAGHLAKADGRISEAEIAHTEQMFVQMGLTAEQRKEAIAHFHRGAAADFKVEPAVAAFVEATGGQRQLQQTLLFFLISLASVDQSMDASEQAALLRIAELLGMSRASFEQLLRMAQAQGQFHQQGSGPGATSRPHAVQDAYTALGVERSVSDKDLKRAYRKLMSENHPDKLIAKGVPEDMVKLATERSQEIQAAYELIRKERGMGKT